MLDQAATDVDAECRELDAYVSGLDDVAWNDRTATASWTTAVRSGYSSSDAGVSRRG